MTKFLKINDQAMPGVHLMLEYEPGIWQVHQTFFANTEQDLIDFLLKNKFFPEIVMEAFENTQYTREGMLEFLHIGPCEVTFTKVNGETRQMTCTLNEEVLKGEGVWKEPSEVTKKENTSVIAVYDTISKGWRSFRVDSVTKFQYIG